MTKPFPPPSIKPFQRLQIEDGVLINSERWQVAHDYHHQRQNVHYQSVNQPGIVCGLGVRLIEPTDNVSDIYKDGLSIQIQPGIAIDLYGNIIVVENPENFHINSEVKTKESRMVYVVVSYPDPKNLDKSLNNGQEDNFIVTEKFRILEKTDEKPVSDNEVEVCRIRLQQPQNQKIKLENPQEVFNPGDNQLDLRYRFQVRTRPQAVVRLATIKGEEDSPNGLAFANFRSLTSLYPALQVADFQEKDRLKEVTFANISNYDLLYLKEQQSERLNNSEVEDIKKYLNTGGVVLIEISIKTTDIITKQQLQKAIAKIEDIESSDRSSELATLAEIRPNLEADLKTIQNSLNQEINSEQNHFAQWLETPLKNWEDLEQNHPLRTEPFLFAALPSIDGQPIQILTGGGLVIIIGHLSSAWGFNLKLDLPRETIRTAQEMAINILHFAWRRRQMSQLLGNSKE